MPSLTNLGDLSKLVTENPAYKEQQFLSRLALKDPGLSGPDRSFLADKLRDSHLISDLLSGATGAIIAYRLAQFFKLSSKAQVLMSMLGFGVGSLLVEAIRKNRAQSGLQFNKEKQVYEVH